ncbi:phospholipase [Ginsengibacter hankyongi]|uniref:Phospholipase n=1 Tax=Ginsengibacter hankyongi TaxID=2607284 RepID=A0A5J5IIK9_9BACT|nr:phospholipase D-like domain-containing protein [Ginsengibacter hankyongi]KAA9040621.1 phospholipase [Ginsengibacter hankyongi]
MSLKKTKLSNGYTSNNQVKLIRAGKEYFNLLLQLIHEAKENIHIQSYIFDDDVTGRLVADAMKAAVKRNVDVYLMADGYASQGMSKSFVHGLRNAGIRFRYFEPFFASRYFYFGRRMHHKLAVADMKYALVGGINIADRYNDMPGKPAWLDFALYAEGEIAKQLCILCWKTWNGFSLNMALTPCELKQISFSIPLGNRSEVRMRRNDWVRRKNEISSTYVEMLRTSTKQVTILCSYFLPGKIIRKQIVNAIKRGVTIRVIAAGHSDVILAKNAERWLYDWLLRNGIELYEYQKAILHGKIAVCDDQWMTIGSYNINNISAYASIELNLDVRNPGFAAQVRKTLEEIIANDCIRITSEHQTRKKNLLRQFIRWCSYQFIRVVFYLFTFYFKHLN